MPKRILAGVVTSNQNAQTVTVSVEAADVNVGSGHEMASMLGRSRHNNAMAIAVIKTMIASARAARLAYVFHITTDLRRFSPSGQLTVPDSCRVRNPIAPAV